MKKLLIIEDDLTFSKMLTTFLSKKGFEVKGVSQITKARKLLGEEHFDLILSDLRLPDGDGTVLLEWIKDYHTEIPLIIMTGYADIQSAVSAMKLGAKDYIAKPLQPDILLQKIEEAMQEPSQEMLGTNPPVGLDTNMAPPLFLEGESEVARKLYNYVDLVAPTPMSVLINGASGTGKEYVAHRIHQLSKRSEGPFIAIDCGAIPKELAASEFFGHIKGSFTGAQTDKTGAFVEAGGGTLFLDEVGNLSYDVQVQLLRALQERKIRPVGSNKEIDVDIRLISATNENLEYAIKDGNFREDLYHRINEFTLRIPLLRERSEDILLFANFFLDQANRELDRKIKGFNAEACTSLQRYSWPGNLRQMKNIIKRATLLAEGEWITAEGIERELIEKNTTFTNDRMEVLGNAKPLRDEEWERKRILDALQQTRYNKSQAAKLLGIDRKTLYNKLKSYGIE